MGPYPEARAHSQGPLPVEYRPKEEACKGLEVGAGNGGCGPESEAWKGTHLPGGTFFGLVGGREGSQAQPEKGQPRSLQGSLMPGSESPVDIWPSPGTSESYGQQGIKDSFVEVVFESGI